MPFLIVIYLVVYCGNKILDRLARVPSNIGLHCESPDHYISIETSHVSEKAFTVWFVDGKWAAGRTFVLSGLVTASPDEPIEGLEIGKRTEIQIYTLPDWFREVRIGQVNARGKCFVGLPWQLAQQVLNEVRENVRQDVRLGFKVDKGQDGEVSFPIYLFELEAPIT